MFYLILIKTLTLLLISEDDIATNGEVGTTEVSSIQEWFTDDRIYKQQRSKSMTALKKASFYDNENGQEKNIPEKNQLIYEQDKKPVTSTISTIYSSNVDLRMSTEPIKYFEASTDTKTYGGEDNIEYIDKDDNEDESLTLRNTLHNEYVPAIVTNATSVTNYLKETADNNKTSTSPNMLIAQNPDQSSEIEVHNVFKTAFLPYHKMKDSQGSQESNLSIDLREYIGKIPDKTQSSESSITRVTKLNGKIPVNTTQANLENESGGEPSPDLKYTNSFSIKNLRKPNIKKRKLNKSIKSVKKKEESKSLGQKTKNELDNEIRLMKNKTETNTANDPSRNTNENGFVEIKSTTSTYQNKTVSNELTKQIKETDEKIIRKNNTAPDIQPKEQNEEQEDKKEKNKMVTNTYTTQIEKEFKVLSQNGHFKGQQTKVHEESNIAKVERNGIMKKTESMIKELTNFNIENETALINITKEKKIGNVEPTNIKGHNETVKKESRKLFKENMTVTIDPNTVTEQNETFKTDVSKILNKETVKTETNKGTKQNNNLKTETETILNGGKRVDTEQNKKVTEKLINLIKNVVDSQETLTVTELEIPENGIIRPPTIENRTGVTNNNETIIEDIQSNSQGKLVSDKNDNKINDRSVKEKSSDQILNPHSSLRSDIVSSTLREKTTTVDERVQTVKTNVINTIQSLTNILNTIPISNNSENKRLSPNIDKQNKGNKSKISQDYPVSQSKSSTTKAKNKKLNSRRFSKKAKQTANITKNRTTKDTTSQYESDTKSHLESRNIQPQGKITKVTEVNFIHHEPKEKVTVEFEKDIIFLSDGETHKLILKPREKILEGNLNDSNKSVPVSDKLSVEANAQEHDTNLFNNQNSTNSNELLKHKSEDELKLNEEMKFHESTMEDNQIGSENILATTFQPRQENQNVEEILEVEDSDEWEDEREEEKKGGQEPKNQNTNQKPITKKGKDKLESNSEIENDNDENRDSSEEIVPDEESEEENDEEDFTESEDDEYRYKTSESTESSNIITKQLVRTCAPGKEHIDLKGRSSSSSSKIDSSTDENSDFLSVKSEFSNLETFLNEISVQPKSINNGNRIANNGTSPNQIDKDTGNRHSKKEDDKKKAVQILKTKITQIQQQENGIMSNTTAGKVLDVKISSPEQLFENTKVDTRIESPTTSNSDKELAVLKTYRGGTSSSADISSEILDSSSRCDVRDETKKITLSKYTDSTESIESKFPPKETENKNEMSMTENKQEILEILKQSLSNETVLEDIVNKLFTSVMGETTLLNKTIASTSKNHTNNQMMISGNSRCSIQKTSIYIDDQIISKPLEANVSATLTNTSKTHSHRIPDNASNKTADNSLQSPPPERIQVNNVDFTPQSLAFTPTGNETSEFEVRFNLHTPVYGY